jgi:transcriptional regulator with XRE-family HTH domain
MITDMPTMTGEDLMQELGRLIDEACLSGDTNLAIAERAGVQKDLISGLRNGTYRATPTIARVESILKALGFSLKIAREK